MLSVVNNLLRAILDVCYLVFGAAVVSVTVFIEMGCCESKNKYGLMSEEDCNATDSHDCIYGNDEESTKSSPISEVSENATDATSLHNTDEYESNFDQHVIVPLQLQPHSVSDLPIVKPKTDSFSTADNSLFVPPVHTCDFLPKDKLTVCFQDVLIKPECISHTETLTKEGEGETIKVCGIGNFKSEDILEFNYNLHDTTERPVTCFQISNVQQDLKSNAESLHSEGNLPVRKDTLTPNCDSDNVCGLGIDLLNFPIENKYSICQNGDVKQVLLESHGDLINSDKDLALNHFEHNTVPYPDVISHYTDKENLASAKIKTCAHQTSTYSEVLQKTIHENRSVCFANANEQKSEKLSSESINRDDLARKSDVDPVITEFLTKIEIVAEVTQKVLQEHHELNHEDTVPVVLLPELPAHIPHEDDFSPFKMHKERKCSNEIVQTSPDDLVIMENITSDKSEEPDIQFELASCRRPSTSTMLLPVHHNPDYAQASEDQFLHSLAPICEISQIEVVSMNREMTDLIKRIQQADKLLYLMTAYTFFHKLTTPVNLSSVNGYLSYCTEQMKSALYRIKGTSLLSRIQVFLTQFDTVFCVSGNNVSKQPNGEEWLHKSLLTTLADVVEDCTQQGQKSISEICKTLDLVLGSVDIPWVGKIVPETLKLFIKNHVKTVNVLNDSVLLVTNVNTSLGTSANQQSLKAIIDYFKNLLKSTAVPCNELSHLLCNDKPELLGALVDRRFETILALILKDESFKCENGLLMLKGYTPVHRETLLKPTVPSDVSLKARTSYICACSSGIVMCVGKSRATIWCSYSQTCKNIFVIAKRSKTTIDNVLGESFTNVLREGDKVVFTSEAESENGLTIDFAVKVKVVAEAVRQTSCLCSKMKDMDVFLQPVMILNGTPLSDSLTFFWNCKGIVINIQGTKGIVKCRISNSSDRYFLVYFTSCVWLTGCDLSKTPNDFSGHLKIGEEVEVDASLQNHNNGGFLTWFGACIRKLSSNSSGKFRWNCSGTIVGIDSHHFVISMQSDTCGKNSSSQKSLLAPFQNIYLREDGSLVTQLTEDLLKINDTVVFDVELDSPCIAKFLRKCRRPVALESVNKEFSVVPTALKAEMCSNIPLFTNVNTSIEMLFFDECKEVQAQQKIFVDSLSQSTETYNLTTANAIKSMKNTTCQTVSTGPVFSSLIPI